MQKAAVIGIGSNSVRMLVAEIEEDGFTRLTRDREGTRLFAGLDDAKNLNRQSMEKTAAAVKRMAESARRIGCDQIHIFATSASRDARNGAEFLEMLRGETGVGPEIVSGEEEAVLSFLGATEVAGPGALCGVIDIGGGSTEIVTGRGRAIRSAVSCQMGAVRLYQMFAIERKEDMEAVEFAAKEILKEKWPPEGEKPGADGSRPVPPEVWIGTGGTFTALAALVKRIRWEDRRFMHGTKLPLKNIREIGRMLAGMTVEERLRLGSVQPGRADIVVHGICILLAVMETVGIGEITVSEYGNLDGYLRDRYCR